MGDLIDRQNAIDVLELLADKMSDEGRTVMAQAVVVLKDLQSAEPERKKGKWVVTSEFEDCRYVKCNQCKVTQVFYYSKPLTNFCPNCGADMRGE